MEGRSPPKAEVVGSSPTRATRGNVVPVEKQAKRLADSFASGGCGTPHHRYRPTSRAEPSRVGIVLLGTRRDSPERRALVPVAQQKRDSVLTRRAQVRFLPGTPEGGRMPLGVHEVWRSWGSTPRPPDRPGGSSAQSARFGATRVLSASLVGRLHSGCSAVWQRANL